MKFVSDSSKLTHHGLCVAHVVTPQLCRSAVSDTVQYLAIDDQLYHLVNARYPGSSLVHGFLENSTTFIIILTSLLPILANRSKFSKRAVCVASSGTLKNGMAYYVRANRHPQERAELRIAIKVSGEGVCVYCSEHRVVSLHLSPVGKFCHLRETSRHPPAVTDKVCSSPARWPC